MVAKKKKKRKLKLKMRNVLILLTVILIFVGVIYYILQLPINNIYITGNNILSDAEVIDWAKVDSYPSFLLTSSSEVENNLSNNPYIENVDVNKKLGNKIEINVTEYKTIALINQGSLKEALVLMSKFIEDYPNSSLIPNAYYWVGQINYHQKQYSQARENFLKVTKYKDSNKRAEAIYKLGQIAENLNDKTKALKFYQVVLKTYPGKTEALLAKQAIENLDKK